jgi:hypothetical protein
MGHLFLGLGKLLCLFNSLVESPVEVPSTPIIDLLLASSVIILATSHPYLLIICECSLTERTAHHSILYEFILQHLHDIPIEQVFLEPL